ncbi:MAG TPA: asparagine synthase-related protein [Gemmatimonadaceae bacterium]|nr:asparagine synthase-related protein [Gemmatimonadaceae bacterium]
MRGFLAAFAPGGSGADGRAREWVDDRLRRARGRDQWNAEPQFVTHGDFAAAWWTEPGARVSASRVGSMTIIGDARLGDISLDRFAELYRANGERTLDDLDGEFALVLYDDAARSVVAVRDAFGVKRLFFRRVAEDGALFASHLDLLSESSVADGDFAHCYLTGELPTDPTCTVWSDVRVVPSATSISLRHGSWRMRRYWQPGVAKPEIPRGEQEQRAAFDAHLRAAVTACIDADVPAWCEISGGLDSGTVFAIAHDAGRVAGTYSYVDDMPGADERRFISAIVGQRPVRNDHIEASYPWEDDGAPPPLTDEPRIYYPYWARDRSAERIVRDAGGRYILSGAGSDYYLSGSAVVIADALASWRVGNAVREAHAVAMAQRRSMWATLWRYGVRPWATSLVRFGADHDTHLRRNSRTFLEYASTLHELPLTWPAVEKRYPFLNRALVDYALALPSRMVFHDGLTKQMLRGNGASALLPEIVRARRTKGWIDGRASWALSHEQRLVDRLVRDPLIAQAGWIDGAELRATIARTRTGISPGAVPMMRALSLETWLAVRTGRWPQIAHD